MHGVERAIAAIGRRQDNVVTHDQLLQAGLGRGAIARRLQARTMQWLHRGIYLLGAAPATAMGRARAAVLACGDGAVVSHRSAAVLHGLLPGIAGAGQVDVTVVGRNPGSHAGIRLHRPRTLGRRDVTKMRGIPVTSVARTICDLAGTESRNDTELAFQEALYKRAVAPAGLAAVLKREPRRSGAAVIAALIEDPRMTRSERERRLLKLIGASQLPRPVTNVRIDGFLVDVLWPGQKLIVEFDGWGAHGHRQAFERDRKRDQVLLAAGYRVLRITDRQLRDEPLAVLTRIAQALHG